MSFTDMPPPEEEISSGRDAYCNENYFHLSQEINDLDKKIQSVSKNLISRFAYNFFGVGQETVKKSIERLNTIAASLDKQDLYIKFDLLKKIKVVFNNSLNLTLRKYVETLQSASELKSALESNESFKLSKISGIVTEKFKRTYNKAPVISFKMTIDGGETELKGAFKKEKNGRCTIAAAGAFGRTFFGVTPSGRKVAVKVVQKKPNEDMKDIIEEVRLLNRVNGFDGLVGASDVFQEGDFIFIVMDQMEGGELSDKKDLSLSQKTTIFRDVGKGVKQCEYLGIVHMDIKAENILLTEDNRAKLADFGLSLENGQSGCRGTLLYMAPEVFNQTPVSSQTDVYSVGVLLYIKLYNRLPYLGVTNLKELCNKKIKGYDILDELTSPPQSYAERFFNGRFDVMEAYNQLIRDCMQSNQDSRPTPKELLSRLEKIQRLLDTRGNNQPVQ